MDTETKKEKAHGHSDTIQVNLDDEHEHDHHKIEEYDLHDVHVDHQEQKKDLNIHAVFLHYLGDALSSIFVLIAGILGKIYNGQEWTKYLDPVSSLLIVGLILWTTLPLLKECSEVLLQIVPSQVNIPELKEKLLEVKGIHGVHDLHVWQLVDNLIIASLHASVLDTDSINSNTICQNVKEVMHCVGIHSSTIQLEFIHIDTPIVDCDQNCVVDCPEDWCCKVDVSPHYLHVHMLPKTEGS